MGRHLNPIGGEFWYDKRILKKGSNNFNEKKLIYLDGGQSAIEFILSKINFNKNEYILMPSYLCPTILFKFTKNDINILYYEIGADLSIDINSVKTLIKKYDISALFFINYFGFYHNDESITYLRELKEEGIILVEDAVQMLWFNRLGKFIGDYVFNSYRKFLPYDGSLVLCSEYEKYVASENRYHDIVTEARTRKTEYIENNNDKEEEFLKLFNQAEKYYYKEDNVNGMDIGTQRMLNNIDFMRLKKQRLENFKYLYSNLIKFKNIKLIFSYEQIEDNIPLALPVIIGKRDIVRQELRKYHIYCPVHWDITNESWATNFPISVNLSKSILSIPIDWRYSKNDIDYFIDCFNKVLDELKE